MMRTYVGGRLYFKFTEETMNRLPELLTPGYVEEVTVHWTAGAHNQPYRYYQILIGTDHVLVSANILGWGVHQHTYARNYANIGVSFMAMAGATEQNGGPYAITKVMVERCAWVLAQLKKRYKLGWDCILDHRFWAELDGYANLRWEALWPVPWEGGELLRHVLHRKAKWYLEKI